MDEEEFWKRVAAAAQKAERAYMATVANGKPKVRVVFPAVEDQHLWIATKPRSAKARHLAIDPNVELFFEVGGTRPTTHLTVSGTARVIDDSEEKKRLWSAKVFRYNLSEFWPDGPASPDLVLLRIDPTRVELGVQPAMWQGTAPEIWRPSSKAG